jgi:hypothetical protein
MTPYPVLSALNHFSQDFGLETLASSKKDAVTGGHHA